MSVPRDIVTAATSPSHTNSSGSPTNPFTRNQDAKDLARRLRRTSIGASSNTSGPFDHGIDEEDEEEEDEGSHNIKPFPSILSPTSPKNSFISAGPLGHSGNHAASEGSFRRSASSESSGGLASHAEEELPLKPSLTPVGADHQNDKDPSALLPDPDAEYSKPRAERRSSLTHEGVDARARGIVRTYSMVSRLSLRR